VLPTGRLFGRISKKGPNKKRSGRTILRPNFGRFRTKRTNHTDKNSIYLKPKFLQKGKLLGQNLFPQWPNFSSRLAEKSCKELAPLLSREVSVLRQYELSCRQQTRQTMPAGGLLTVNIVH
jgi:hypothetical protein